MQKLPFVYRRLEEYVQHPANFLSLLEMLRRYKLLNTTLVNITIKQIPVAFYLGLNDKLLTLKALNKYLSALIDALMPVMPSKHSRLPDLVTQTFGERVEHALN